MMRRITILTVALVLVSSMGLTQVHPTLQRGFTPESAYEAGGIDAINLFNGSLTLALPIGPRYPVGGNLSYGLTLVYSSLLWEYTMQPDDDNPTPACEEGDCVALEATPAESLNAGLGWRLSLGELFQDGVWPNPGNEDKWMYVAPDGSRHLLIHTLHEHETHAGDVFYTRDNTYLRMTVTAYDQNEDPIEAVLEKPDGTAHTFEAGHYFNTMSLKKIEDRFGNSLIVTYHEDGQGEIDEWILTDSSSRVQRIYWTTVASERVVDRVELTTFGTPSPAMYQFIYDSAPDGTAIEETCKDQQWGVDDVWVPLLREIELPDGTSYRMTDGTGSPAYYMDNWKEIGHTCTIPYSGILKRLVLPTGGVYEWDFGRYEYPTAGGIGGCNETGNELWQVGFGSTAGVVEKRVTSAPGQTATWSYHRDPVTDPLVDSVTTTVTSPDDNETDHYFRTQACRYDETAGGQTAWTGWDYGLPFTPDITDPSGVLYRSVAYFKGTGAGRTLLRARHLRYQHDQLPPLSSALDWYDTNRRVSSSSSVYLDDSSSIKSSSFSDFDGLGHYRQSTASGFGAGNRTETTSFNPSSGSYSIDNDNNYNGTFALPDPQEPWIIGLYDFTTQLDGGAHAKQEHCFDSQTGAATRIRVLEDGTTRQATDVLTVLAYDSDGNLESESLFGGDVQGGLGTGSQSDICDVTWTGDPEYELLHTYEHGALKTT